MLIGGCYEDTAAPFQLKNTLPVNIKTLVLATGSSSKNIPDLVPQIEEVVSQFPRLKAFQTRDYTVILSYFPPGTIPAKYQLIKEACFHRGIQFDFKGLCSLTIKLQHCPYPLGMWCTSQWNKTYKLRIDSSVWYETVYE
jgi:hypothetical protein